MPMTVIRVRSYHLDGYGHVNNARYLEFLEEARWAFFEQQNWLPFLESIMMVVTRIDIQYRRAAQEGHELHIKTRVDAVEPRQVLLTQTIVRADTGKTITEAGITLVPVGSNGRAIDLPEELSTFLTQHITS